MYLGVNPQKNGANLLLADVAAVRRHIENKCSLNDFLCVRLSVRRTQVGQVCAATKETNVALL
jgi:hypothetical protein